jgi:hypothetical protein
MNRDLYSNCKVVQSVDAKVYTADENGVTVDRGASGGYAGNPMFVANFGISGDTLSGSVFVDIELEESDDGSVWTDVADKDIQGKQLGLPAGTVIRVDDPAEDETTYRFGYKGGKRYVRPVMNFTGTHTNGIEISIDAVLPAPLRAPVA